MVAIKEHLSSIEHLKNFIKERKFLAISIALHITIISSLVIVLPLLKFKGRETVKIQEVELFKPEAGPVGPAGPVVPPGEQIKDTTKPEMPPQPVAPPKPKKPALKPLESNLRSNIMKKWDTIEKKNELNPTKTETKEQPKEQQKPVPQQTQEVQPKVPE